MLAMAMAARNSGGIVIAQVRQLATRGSLGLRDVKVPAALIDYVYVDPDQWQTYITRDSPYYAGALRRPVRPEPPLPLDVRKIIARRSLLEFPPGAICNLGFGISQLIGRVAWEEGITDQLVLTVEQGIFGGVPVAGNEGGAGFNYQAMIDQPYMFDFYDGGGLDIASLSFAEVDAEGNVNVHAFEGRVRGPGGFPNISARTGKINFVGTLTAQGLELDIDGGVRVVREGALHKFVPRGPRDLVQRPARARARAAGPLRHGSRGLRARGRRPGPDRGRAGHRCRARRARPDGLPPAGGRPAARRWMRGCTRPDRWAWRPTSGGVRERARRARAGRVSPTSSWSTRRSTCSRASSCSSSAMRLRAIEAAEDVRAVVVSGRGDARVLRRFARRRVRGPGGRGRPRPPPARPGRVAPAGRAADADDRGDRGPLPRRRARARAVLRHPRRIRDGQARSARGAAGGHPGRRRDAAAAAGGRCDAGQGADPDRPRPDRDRGRGDRPRQPRRAGGQRRRGRRRARSRDRAARSRCRPRGEAADRRRARSRHRRRPEAEFEASERIFATEDMVEGARAFFEKRDPRYTGR